jgi:hypothetical protein
LRSSSPADDQVHLLAQGFFTHPRGDGARQRGMRRVDPEALLEPAQTKVGCSDTVRKAGNMVNLKRCWMWIYDMNDIQLSAIGGSKRSGGLEDLDYLFALIHAAQ